MNCRRPLLRAVVIFALGLCGLAARAQTITKKDTTVLVNGDGSAVVIEQLSLDRRVTQFTSDIRVTRPGPVANRTVFLDLLGLVDVTQPAAEKALVCRTHRHEGSLRIACTAPAPTSELKLTYGLRNAVEFLSAHDELYYATAGGATSTSVRIILPDNAPGAFRVQAFLRAQHGAAPRFALWSSDGRLPLQIEQGTIYTAAPGPLQPGIELVADVFLEKGVLTAPHPLVRAGWFLQSNPIVVFPLATLALMLVLRRIRGGASADRSVAPQYAPPEGLTPAEAGVLIDDRLDPRDVGATFVDLAIRGYLRIEPDVTAGKTGTPATHDFIFRKLREADTGLAEHERTLLFHTFYGGQWTKLSSLRLRFPEIVPYLRAELLNALRARGFYRVDPEQAQVWRMVSAAGAAVLLVAAEAAGIVNLFDSRLVGGAALLLSAAIVYLVGRRMTAKTRRGMKVYIHLLGLHEFIRTVDADRMQRDPGRFESLLPYAMALGVEHHWAEAFRGIAPEAPEWFGWGESGGFDPRVLANALRALNPLPTPPVGLRGRRTLSQIDAGQRRAKAARA